MLDTSLSDLKVLDTYYYASTHVQNSLNMSSCQQLLHTSAHVGCRKKMFFHLKFLQIPDPVSFSRA